MKFRYPLFSAILFILFHLACHIWNLYFLIWWSDIVAHFIAGATAGLLWWWLLDAKAGFSQTYSKMLAFSVVTFSTFISVLWEFWEFSNWRFDFLKNTIGKVEGQYYPFLGNNLGDILWGLLGGLLISIIYFCVKRKYKQTI